MAKQINTHIFKHFLHILYIMYGAPEKTNFELFKKEMKLLFVRYIYTEKVNCIAMIHILGHFSVMVLKPEP